MLWILQDFPAMCSSSMLSLATIRIRSLSMIFSADVKNGQKIAIVGPTGAGKTTMVEAADAVL